MAKEYKWYKIYDFKEHGAEPQELFTLRTIDVEGKMIVLARNQKGYFAVDDKCPHAGYPLSHGKCLEDGTILCVYHRHCFSLENGREQTGQGEYVETHPVKETEDGVFVGMKKKSWWLW